MWSSERSPMILTSRIPLCSDEEDSSDILSSDRIEDLRYALSEVLVEILLMRDDVPTLCIDCVQVLGCYATPS